jgi:hypothetical protein
MCGSFKGLHTYKSSNNAIVAVIVASSHGFRDKPQTHSECWNYDTQTGGNQNSYLIVVFDCHTLSHDETLEVCVREAQTRRDYEKSMKRRTSIIDAIKDKNTRVC